MRSLTVMAGLVPAIHGLQVDPTEAVDASLRWHDGTMRSSVGFNGGWYKLLFDRVIHAFRLGPS
jgi:hypothetical protein